MHPELWHLRASGDPGGAGMPGSPSFSQCLQGYGSRTEVECGHKCRRGSPLVCPGATVQVSKILHEEV